jgi:glycerol-1-phosphate dehydrogenase [NAD(P)+]
MMDTIHNLPRVELRPFESVEEPRRALVVTSGPAWRAVEHRLRGLKLVARIEVTEATTDVWDALAAGEEVAAAEVVYAVGGGLAADAAKYIAARHGLALVVLPTALSVDAFLTATSGVRVDGCVRYLPSKVPETLILDLDVVAAAPPGVRAAGITDVLSIATGCWDWRFAEERGQNSPGMAFVPWVHDNAQAILRGALACAEAAGRGDRDGLKTLFDCLAMEVQLCNQVGHARPEEGSEHYFAYAAENLTGHGLPHGDLVGPGILLAARLQGQGTRTLEAVLRACNVPLDRIAPEATTATLRDLPDYARRHHLPFGIAHTPESWKATA